MNSKTNKKLLIFDLDDTLYLCSGVVKQDYSNLNKIETFPGVKELLSKGPWRSILVSKGDRAIQVKKLEVLGIKDDFHAIIFCPADEDKKGCFVKILNQYPGFDYWVIGNRIDSEIRYGKELGLKTVLIKRGKYKNLKAKDGYEIPDYEIEHFSELGGVLGLK